MNKYHHLALFFILLFAGCSGVLMPMPAPKEQRPLPFIPGGAYHAEITNGLSIDDRKAYYTADEGIHYLPVDVLASLKRANGFVVYDELFFAKPERMGMLPNYADPTSDLPIGLTSSTEPGFVAMAGINCSTCHTSVIMNEEGHYFLVDGASSQFAVDRFIEGMVRSLVATLINPIEFEAFYQRYQVRAGSGLMGAAVLEEDSNDFGTDELRDSIEEAVNTGEIEKLERDLKKFEKISGMSMMKTTGTSLDSAYPKAAMLSTRLGMYTYMAKRFVFFFKQTSNAEKPEDSKVGDSGLGRSNPWSVTKRMFGSHFGYIQPGASEFTPKLEGGPINTPHMWDYDRQKWIFWTGPTNSMLERNLAQGVALVTDFNWETFETTVSIKKLEDVSKLARKAQPPVWPQAVLGKIDAEKAGKGKAVFESTCLGCHDPKLGETTVGQVEYNFVDVGTDDAYYKGQLEMLEGFDLFSQAIAPFIGKVKTEAAKREGIGSLGPYELGRLPVVWRRPKGNMFAAKPLMGIWATAPFLHNGSVPSIADLLKKPEDRPKKFWVGSFTYDSKNLGFKSEFTDHGFEFVTQCATGCEGNSNSGHLAGTDLSEDEKADLLEFLKSY